MPESAATAAENPTSSTAYSFDPSADRCAGTAFKDVAKTLTPGTAPGHHDGVCAVDVYNQTVEGEVATEEYDWL